MFIPTPQYVAARLQSRHRRYLDACMDRLGGRYTRSDVMRLAIVLMATMIGVTDRNDRCDDLRESIGAHLVSRRDG